MQPPVKMPDAPWLVTGATGLLGSELTQQLAGRVPLHGTWHSRQPAAQPGISLHRLDVADADAVHRLLHSIRPRVVIHTAYRKNEPHLEQVTAAGAGYVAQAAAALGARLVHLSSDVLLDGEHPPYDENARPGPRQPYGAAKAAAEALVQAALPAAAIVRTSLICRAHPLDPISAWVADSLRTQQPITLFTDEIRSPVWVQDLAAALIELADLPYAGVLNVAGPQPLSRYEMGTRLAARLGLDRSGIAAGSSLDSGLNRPRNCTLDIRRAQRLLRTPLRSYDEGLAAL